MAMVVLILVYWFSGGIKLEHWPKMGYARKKVATEEQHD